MHAYGSLRVVALVRDVEWERHVRDTLGRLSVIRWIRDDGELDQSAGLESANVVLWHLEARLDATAMLATLHRIHAAMPLSSVVLSCRVAPEIARLILTAGRLGVDRVALRGYDDLARVVANVLCERRYGAAVDQILTRLGLSENRAAPMLAQLIRRAFEAPFGVEQVAREFRIDRKTLHNRLRGAGLPSAAVLISWSRLFAAGWLLDDPLQSVASVGRSLRFTSASELRGMFARYVHARPTELRRRGVLNAIIGAFRAATIGSDVNSAHPLKDRRAVAGDVTTPAGSPPVDGIPQSRTGQSNRAF
jgi:AraC-like DNA-binding protein